MASLREALFGKQGEFKQIETTSPAQQRLFSQILGGLGGLSGQGLGALQGMLGGSQDFLSQLQAPFLRQFQEQTIPNIAERFSGLGAGSQGSSAFGQQLGGAGAKLAEDLAAQSGQLGLQSQQQGLQQLLALLGFSQAPQFESIFDPGTEGGLGGLLGGLGQGVGLGLSGAAGGGIGAGISGLSGLLGNLFKQRPGGAKLQKGAYGLYPTSGFESLA